MGLGITIAALALSAGGLILAVLLDRRPYRPGKRNAIPAMIVCLIACLVLIRHLIALLAR